MINYCVKFSEPDLNSEECIVCWKNEPELFFNCIKAEYEQIKPQRKEEVAKVLT